MDSEWKCFGASSPADLEIINPTDKKVQLIFIVSANDSGYEKLGILKLQPQETKVICLENEGNITDGLFIYFNETVSKITLSNTEINKIDISSKKYQVELTEEIIKVID